MAKVKKKKLMIPSAGKDIDQQHLLFIAGGNAKWCSQFGRQFGSFLKIKLHFPYNVPIPLLGIYTREIKTCLHKYLYENVFYQFYSQSPKTGNKLNVHQLLNG